MKELSLFMLVIAAIFLLSVVFKNVLHKNKYRNLFFIPEQSYMNITWGLLFYTAYGYLISHTIYTQVVYLILGALLLIYLFYLFEFRKFFNGTNKPILTKLIVKIINRKIEHQQKFDKVHTEYSIYQSLNILGLHNSVLKNPNEIEKRYKQLLKLERDINNPYYTKMLNKAYDTLKDK